MIYFCVIDEFAFTELVEDTRFSHSSGDADLFVLIENVRERTRKWGKQRQQLPQMMSLRALARSLHFHTDPGDETIKSSE